MLARIFQMLVKEFLQLRDSARGSSWSARRSSRC